MPAHVSQQIREAVVAALEPVLMAKVYSGRVWALEPEDLPAALVYTRNEAAEYSSTQTLDRVLDLQVDLRVRAAEHADDYLDDMAVVVEQTLNGSTLGGLVTNCVITTREMGLSAEGDAEHGFQMMTFTAWYRTPESDPTTAV